MFDRKLAKMINPSNAQKFKDVSVELDEDNTIDNMLRDYPVEFSIKCVTDSRFVITNAEELAQFKKSLKEHVERVSNMRKPWWKFW